MFRRFLPKVLPFLRLLNGQVGTAYTDMLTVPAELPRIRGRWPVGHCRQGSALNAVTGAITGTP